MRKTSFVLPCRMNADVVPEKYRSASCAAHAGNHSGSFSAGRWCSGSGVMGEHSAQVRFEDARRLLELIGEAGEVLQLADGLLGLSHALGRRIHLAAEEIGILAVHGGFRERRALSLDPIELDRDDAR